MSNAETIPNKIPKTRPSMISRAVVNAILGDQGGVAAERLGNDQR